MVVQDQRLSALVAANQVRSKRAQLKRELKAGTTSAAALLADPPDELRTVGVHEFLSWLPRVGRWRAQNLMRGIVYSPTLKIEQIGPGSRAELAERIRQHVCP